MKEKLSEKAKEIEQGLEKFKSEEDAQSQVSKDKAQGERIFAEIVGGLIFGVFAGYYIDNYFNTQPIFLLIFIILGLAGSIYNIYKATGN